MMELRASMGISSPRMAMTVSKRRGAMQRSGVGICPRQVAFGFWSPTAAWAMPGTVAEKEERKWTLYEKLVTVGLISVTSFLNGAVFGGLFGMISGAWSSRTWSTAWATAKTNGMSWGSLSAAYSGLQTTARVIREKSDKYNNVLGACGSGALFSLPQGSQAAIRGCASFALFSYVIETVIGHQPQDRILEEKLMSGD